MALDLAHHLSPGTGDQPYRTFSLMELALKISAGDREALAEFHSRRVFTYGEEPPTTLVDYVWQLHRHAVEVGEWQERRDIYQLADLTRDLLMDRFSNLPSSHGATDGGGQEEEVEQEGADCRLYFKAFASHRADLLATEPPSNPIEEDALSAVTLQRFVNRQYHLCRKEAERRINLFWSRYRWLVKGGSLTVWLPRVLSGNERAAWLEAKIPDADPTASGERDRVQEVIESLLLKEQMIPLGAVENLGTPASELYWAEDGHPLAQTLGQTVAAEKVNKLEEQRPAVQVLGADRLKQLIVRAFEALDCGDASDSALAKEFGLSKATFSRFAGSQWHRGELTGEKGVPDLWRNTAHVMARHPYFKDVAREVGVWPQIQEIIESQDQD